MLKKILILTFLAFPAQAQILATKNLNILFIGNSYIAANDLPKMVEKIAASDTRGNYHIHTESVTIGGAGLKKLWDEGQALKALRSQAWNFVVLQDQSVWAQYKDSIQSAYQIAPIWANAIKLQDSKAVLFITWPRKPDSAWYSNADTAFIKNAQLMQAQTNFHSKKIAALLNAVEVPIGDYWLYAQGKNSKIELYSGDGSHPSVVGSYFTALVFYRYFTARPLDDVDYFPVEVKADDVNMIKLLAAAKF
ncbi:MAG: hypothetical protein V4694_06860 [Pseudomonadota bacterium]